MISATIKKDTEIHGSPLQRCFVFVFIALVQRGWVRPKPLQRIGHRRWVHVGIIAARPLFLCQHLYRAIASTRVRKTVPVMFRED